MRLFLYTGRVHCSHTSACDAPPHRARSPHAFDPLRSIPARPGRGRGPGRLVLLGKHRFGAFRYRCVFVSLGERIRFGFAELLLERRLGYLPHGFGEPFRFRFCLRLCVFARPGSIGGDDYGEPRAERYDRSREV